MRQGIERLGWYPTSGFVVPPVGSNPWGVEGYKTIAYEIAEDLGWTAPDVVVVPSAYSDGLYGIWKGWTELQTLGLVKTAPRMIAAEPFGPLAHALERGLEAPEMVEAPAPSVAFSIASRYGTWQGLAALRESGGAGVRITDEGVFEAQRALAREEGLFVEPSSATSITAVMQLAARKALDPGQTIVVVLTSGGLKDPGASRTWLPAVPAAGADFDRLLTVLREPMDWRWTDSLGVALSGHGRARPHGRVGARGRARGARQPVDRSRTTSTRAPTRSAAAAAAATERIAIGLGVVNPYTRHPALVAMETAALAGIAPGRVVLGLGSSNRRVDRGADGDPVQDAAARPARGRRDRAPPARRRARDVRRRGLLDRRRRARVAAAGAGAHPARREGPAGPRARGRDRRRRALLDPRLARARPPRARQHRERRARGLRGHRVRAVAIGRRRRARRARWCGRCSRATSARSTASPSWPTPASAPARTQPFRDALAAGRASPRELVTDEMIDALAVAGTPAECRAALARLGRGRARRAGRGGAGGGRLTRADRADAVATCRPPGRSCDAA